MSQMIFSTNTLDKTSEYLTCWNKATTEPMLTIVYEIKSQRSQIRIDVIKIIPFLNMGNTAGNSLVRRALQYSISELSKKSDIITFSMLEEYQHFFPSIGCKFIEDLELWVLKKQELQAGVSLDYKLAEYLGWKNLSATQTEIIGIPPGVDVKPELVEKSRIVVPSWSSDKAAALGLLLSLKEQMSYDYQLTDSGDIYSVTINYKEDSFKSQQPSMALAISDVIIQIFEFEIEKIRQNDYDEEKQKEEKK